jgi:hypothetical protein
MNGYLTKKDKNALTANKRFGTRRGVSPHEHLCSTAQRQAAGTLAPILKTT